jgi:TolA-binding protein
MKKIMILGLVIVSVFVLTNTSYPRCGGDAFAGSLAGSAVGSMVGTSIASRSSSSNDGDDSGRRALRAVDNLDEEVSRKIKSLSRKITKLEQRVAKLEKNKKPKI